MATETRAPGIEFRAEGRCPICRNETAFVAKRDSPLPEKFYPNWFRGDLKCQSCGSIPRQRALFAVLEMLYPNWRELAIHESSPSTGGASARLRQECPGYVASQYNPALGFGNTHPSGRYRSEDLERQTFDNSVFDIVITQDVFEHLFAPDRAIREIARTLKPGGAHICTVPLVNRNKPSVRRARITTEGVDHILPPSYHGNPMSTEGSLCTVDWGYDIMEYLTSHSGMPTTMYYIDDLSRGIRAYLIEVLVSRKVTSIPFV